MSCRARREGDEMVCSACGLRWGVGEFAPRCWAELKRPVEPGHGWKALPPVPVASVTPNVGDKPYVCGPFPVPLRPLPPEQARALLDDLKAKLAASPGAKWKDKK